MAWYFQILGIAEIANQSRIAAVKLFFKYVYCLALILEWLE